MTNATPATPAATDALCIYALMDAIVASPRAGQYGMLHRAMRWAHEEHMVCIRSGTDPTCWRRSYEILNGATMWNNAQLCAS